MSQTNRTQLVVGVLAVVAIAGMLIFSAVRPPVEAAAVAAGADVEYLTPFGKPTRPFSPAVRVGDVIFLSGQIGTDA